MKEIKLLSRERNKLIRILENYEKYVKKDNSIEKSYKDIVIQDIHLIYQRAMGQAPKEKIELSKNIDNSVFGFGDD